MDLLTGEATGLVKILPSRLRFPVIDGVIDGVQPGDVFIDDARTPSVALVVSRFGFTHVLGAVDDDTAEPVVRALHQHPRLRGRYLLWYDPSPRILSELDALGDERARTRERVSYDVPAGSLNRGDAERRDDVSVEHVDQDNFDDCGVFDLDLGSRFWRSPDEFIDRALGVVVRLRGSIASLCYAAGLGDDRAEIDVATLDECRGQGLALLACWSFIGRCVDAGLEPSWDCFADNEPSVRLADTLGFVERTRYPFHTVNT